ncbi:hypothetical protein CMI47_09560 [Candidatus Pacearchaeota archaeon]|nr:hypothetical protein [Candidatus Pacearchaeota archaeon]|tara:strand:- start:25670 stop:26032 length:363 start_codon:yes stop_codon:yes gene_type:complete
MDFSGIADLWVRSFPLALAQIREDNNAPLDEWPLWHIEYTKVSFPPDPTGFPSVYGCPVGSYRMEVILGDAESDESTLFFVLPPPVSIRSLGRSLFPTTHEEANFLQARLVKAIMGEEMP